MPTNTNETGLILADFFFFIFFDLLDWIFTCLLINIGGSHLILYSKLFPLQQAGWPYSALSPSYTHGNHNGGGFYGAVCIIVCLLHAFCEQQGGTHMMPY